MNKTIEGELFFTEQIAQETGDLPDTRLCKAFRAKHFGRCPVCDNPSLTQFDHKRLHFITFECLTCRAETNIDYIDIARYKSGFLSSDSLVLLVVDRMTK